MLCQLFLWKSQIWGQENQSHIVTESTLILLSFWQTNKSGDKFLGQGTATLFKKAADWEGGRLVSQRTILLELEFRLLLY